MTQNLSSSHCGALLTDPYRLRDANRALVHLADEAAHHRRQLGPSGLRRTGVERRLRVVFDGELRKFGDRFATQNCEQRQSKVDARGNAATRTSVAIDPRAGLGRALRSSCLRREASRSLGLFRPSCCVGPRESCEGRHRDRPRNQRPPRACSMVAEPRRIGWRPESWRGDIRRCAPTPTFCSSTTARS